MIVRVYLTIGFPAAKVEDEIEVDDDCDDDEIEEQIADWASNYIEYGRRD